MALPLFLRLCEVHPHGNFGFVIVQTHADMFASLVSEAKQSSRCESSHS